MKRLWLVKGENHPNCFFKAETEQEARNAFQGELLDFEEYKNSTVTELTFEEFLELCPDEFVISDDVSF